MSVHAGFTGTRSGMSLTQLLTLTTKLWELKKAHSYEELFVFHHGDAIGADREAAHVAHALGFKVVSHPPENSTYRAFVVSDSVLEPRPYLQRDHDIVDASQVVFAAPLDETNEILRSGTWATIRYARKKNNLVILPRGDE